MPKDSNSSNSQGNFIRFTSLAFQMIGAIGFFSWLGYYLDQKYKSKTPWWTTSALESNIGLNAIAQWTFLQNNSMPQGLGTGGLYNNNFDCPLEVKNGQLQYNPNVEWNVNIK